MSDLARAGAVAPPPKPDPEVATPPSRPPSIDPPRSARPVGPVSTEAHDEDVAPAPPPAAPAAVVESPESVLEDLRALLESIPELLRLGQPPAWPALQSVLERVTRSLEESGDLFWLANGVAVPAGLDYLAFHQARVTVLAIRMAMTIGLERDQVTEVGAAAALSGIGLYTLPADLVRRAESLSGGEQTQYHGHPRVAAERLRRWAGPFGRVAPIVLQHQEREQGQGFPQGLRGTSVRTEAKIVGLSHAYMSLTAPLSRRPGLRPYEAVREIVRSKHDAFPSLLVKALLSELTVFPPGTVVRLNSGETGTVVAVNRHHPLRPRVEVVGGRSGPFPAPKTVDLAEAPFLYVTGPVIETGR